ncbi:MAG: cytochrome c3 family protein [Desulfuromonadaceae bacterium]|nr:cytochrome c3 family protein [Desulfuromonadaceae bacterium]MDD5106739.1 cytochrome c3 family protein [Desulfuromonadaceae bacterium]
MKNYCAIIAITLSTAMPALAAENHGGDVVYTKAVKTVLFSHKLHVEEKKLSCDLCHARNFVMQSLKAQENDDFTMKSMMNGKYCGACHNGIMAFASNTRCGDCHTGVKRGGA